MELVAPAGSLSKLAYAFAYGADAVYLGLPGLSLRSRAENLGDDLGTEARALAGSRLVYCACNIYFHDEPLRRLSRTLDRIQDFAFDAYIVSDLGAAALVRRRYPQARLHLSTQANCINSEALAMYRDLGFSRVIVGREASMRDIAEMKDRVPEMELEVFVHGAMCVAYSGRCLLSSWMTGRSGNEGDCAHSCRWDYRVAVEERERPGRYYPAFEGDGFTALLSSADLCMIDHLAELRRAGVDAVKIEGRMKSLYYVAMVTRAYRKHIDSMSGAPVTDLAAYRADVDRVSHRAYSTGFYFGLPATGEGGQEYREHHVYLGRVEEEVGAGRFRLTVANEIRESRPIEFVGPDLPSITDDGFKLYDLEGNRREVVYHNTGAVIAPSVRAEPGYLVRTASAADPVGGCIRDTAHAYHSEDGTRDRRVVRG